MNAIYTPKGAALEYSPLACNLYHGCSHGCTYCYSPNCLREDRLYFHENIYPRPGILEALTKDADKLVEAGMTNSRVLLCFTCDPYQQCEETHRLTRQALEILGSRKIPVSVLTKNAPLARCDFDLFREHSVEFGQTIIFFDDKLRQEFEPHASPIPERFSALREARNLGIKTWVSLEPVIDGPQALAVLEKIAPLVGMVKIGKINHDKALEARTDWKKFLADCLTILSENPCGFFIKDSLRKFASEGTQFIRDKSAGQTVKSDLPLFS